MLAYNFHILDVITELKQFGHKITVKGNNYFIFRSF